ncbi:MAG TPA: OmpA family protein [Pyrinomonadaceae bacterium]|nr:OmpA family protein [Pyrinomonadaceae bacterium]
MNNFRIGTSRLLMLVFGIAMIVAAAPMVLAQVTEPTTTRERSANLRTIPTGEKMKFKGVVIRRDADTFIVRDRNRVDTEILLTDDTSVRTHGGWFRSGKKYAVTDILTGLILEVEGRGNAQGQLVANKVRFNESDLRVAIMTDTRVTPVEENQRRMAGQMDELHAIAAEARAEVTRVDERVSALDDYDVQETVSVNFRTNSAVLSPQAKQQLDDLASKISTSKAFVIEVAGHTDSTGSVAKNFRLSQNRAEAVVQYLAVNHKIPLRRFITPMGYGKTDFVAENTTSAGRAQNRRVDVKVLINRGMSRSAASTTPNP